MPWVLALAAFWAAPSPAAACASCGSGDPTLTTMGSGQPFAGRVRLGLDVGYHLDRTGDSARSEEGRLQLGASYSPTEWLVLSITMPVLLRDVLFADLTHVSVLGLGATELRSRFVLFRDRAFAPEHLFGATVGIALPTYLDQSSPNGQLLDGTAQTGTGTVDPLLGLFYTWLADPWSLFASATVRLPFAARYAEAPGVSLEVTAALQYRVIEWLTLRLGASGRGDGPSTVNGAAAPDSEHVVFFAAPDVLLSPVPDLLLVIGVRVPVVQHSPDGRDEGLYASLSVVVDL